LLKWLRWSELQQPLLPICTGEFFGWVLLAMAHTSSGFFLHFDAPECYLQLRQLAGRSFVLLLLPGKHCIALALPSLPWK
jgi:hypothetical protein